MVLTNTVQRKSIKSTYLWSYNEITCLLANPEIKFKVLIDNFLKNLEYRDENLLGYTSCNVNFLSIK